MSRLVNLTGKKFGRLTVVERTDNANDGHARWRCICDCGNSTIACGNDLKKGTTRSCGCLRLDKIDEMARTNTIHGESHSALYAVWSNMKQRCYNPNAPEYCRYGARGITICDEWLNSFQAFYEWALSSGYADNLSIDRIDNDLGYSPLNCRWATPKEQSNNLRSNRRYTINGETRTLTQWCEKEKVRKSTVSCRLRHGWTIEEALNLIPRNK